MPSKSGLTSERDPLQTPKDEAEGTLREARDGGHRAEGRGGPRRRLQVDRPNRKWPHRAELRTGHSVHPVGLLACTSRAHVTSRSSASRSAFRWAASTSCSRPKASRSPTRWTQRTGRSSSPTRPHRLPGRPSASGSRSRRTPPSKAWRSWKAPPPGRSWPGTGSERSCSAIRPRPSRPGWRASVPAPLR